MATVHSRKSITDIAAKYANLLKEHVNLHSLYVYGSHVIGTYRDDSDIDIAVVAEGFTGDMVEVTFKLMKIRREVNNRIEPHPFMVEEFDEANVMA
ncbi:nucleotidyltransferase domain-containing protein [Virgibacillus oceani]